VSTPGQRADVTRYWWNQAEESLTAAGRELEAGACTFAVNRLYYAAFYAVSAALLDRQLSFKKHSAVRIAFHREFVKTGLLDPQWGNLYDRLFEDRQEADYVAITSFAREHVASRLVRCREFLDQIRPLIPSLSQQ